MSTQADVVKKANLKVKVVRSKSGSASSGLQGPKVFKEFWFVFRALIGGDKILEYHQNERKFQECPAYPKGVLHLGSALAVSYHNPEKKQQFSIELAGGSIIFLEAATQALAREWTSCLNAVLFGKGSGPNGALQYFVEVPSSTRLQYEGPCMLEVRDEELTIKTNDGSIVIVFWKLAHIRSFKAKKDMLTLYSGSRSATGVGEYYFKTSQSVQITHAIETVVKKLKYEALGSNQQMMIPQHSMAHSVSAGLIRARPFTSERRRPLPPPPPPSHPAPSPTPSPPRSPPRNTSPSECSVTSSMAAVPDYIASEFIADHDKPCHAQNRKYIPNFRTPEYSTVGEPNQEVGYQRLDRGVGRSKQKSVSPPHQSSAEGYSRLSHQNAPSLPQRNSSRSRSASRSPPPARPLPPPRGEYGKLDHSEGNTGTARTGEEYGKLDHGVGGQANFPPGDEEYGKLDHGVGGHANIHPGDEEYGRLDHGVGGQANIHPTDEEYGRLDHAVMGQVNILPSDEEYGKLDHSAANIPPNDEEYGKLDRGVANEKGHKVAAGYSKLGTPSPKKLPPPPVPAPYKPQPGSAMARIIQDKDGGDHTYSQVSDAVEGGGVQGEELYSEIALVPKPADVEGYGQLNYTPATTLAIPQPSNSTTNTTSSRQPSIKYSRVGSKPRPHSKIDPYASLSDANINEITGAMKQEAEKDEGEYSQLKMVVPPGPAHEVDSLGYCKPWTSFATGVTSGTTSGASNDTPKPSLNGIKKRNSLVNQTNQNGTEALDATYSAVGHLEFEALYDRMVGSEDTPPAPPPRRGSRGSRHSPPASSRARGNKPPVPPPPGT